MKNIIFIAPALAGKGTQSEMLVEKYGYVHISTGDLLREESTKDTNLGIIISNLLKSGELVPDEIVFSLLEKKLLEIKDKYYILDGFPRNVNQAIMYDELLKKLKLDIGVVILLDVDKNVLIERVTGRRLCKNCSSIYNVYTDMAPKNENICDRCGDNLYIRSDDNVDTFNVRYSEYLDKTLPLISYYEKNNVLRKVVGSNDVNKTFSDIVDIIKE